MKLTGAALVLAAILAAPAAFAHCDWINGPVVADARAALAKGDVAPALKWVTAADEPGIRQAFARTLTARAGGGDARAVADQWFFETLVRVHRASEGEPFTGLKGADYVPEAGIEMADHALESDSIAGVEKSLTAAIRTGLHERFAAATEARKHAGESIEAGRRFVHAYAVFVHYVDGVHRGAAAGAAPEHDAHHPSP